MASSRPRRIVGWIAVVLSSTLSSFWAFWGSIESFHEGWYFRELWRNIGLMAVQYLPWMFIPMVAGLLGLWRPMLGVLAHVAKALGVFSLFEVGEVGGLLIGVPVLLLAGLYGYGQAHMVRGDAALRVSVGRRTRARHDTAARVAPAHGR